MYAANVIHSDLFIGANSDVQIDQFQDHIVVRGATGIVEVPNGLTTNRVQQATEPTTTPAGTTATVALNSGNHQTLELGSATGNVTATITVPSLPCAGQLIVTQGATPRNITITLSSGTLVNLGTAPNLSADGANTSRVIDWRWNGTHLRVQYSPVST